MTDIKFRFDVDAPPQTVLDALKTSEGIQASGRPAPRPRRGGPDAVARLPGRSRAVRPAAGALRRPGVAWRTETFPPHWVGTTIHWDVHHRDGGSTVAFRHEGFADIGDAGSAAYTWGQIMVQLKHYAETGTPEPVFA